MADEDRIARVAHALCVADGQDPKADHMLYEVDKLRNRIRETVVPRGTIYVGEARRIIAAVKAIGLLG